MQQGLKTIVSGILVLVVMSAKLGRAENAKEIQLLKLADERFQNQLSVTEEQLFRAVANGKALEGSMLPSAETDPANSSIWPEAYTIRADRLAWLCTDASASAFVDHEGVRMVRIRIKGPLHLDFAKIPFPLIADMCSFSDIIFLVHCYLPSLELDESRLSGLQAQGLNVEGDVYLRTTVVSEGKVDFAGATIGGSLVCRGAHLTNSSGVALQADSAKIDGGAFLNDDFHAVGEVRFVGATIGGNLECDGGWFISTGANSIVLSADSAKIGRNVFLRQGFHAQGAVNFVLANIGGNLDCNNSDFVNTNINGSALIVDDAQIVGSVFLRDHFHAAGMVNFTLTKIGGNLDCSFGHFINTNANGLALNAYGAKIEGSLLLYGHVDMDGALDLRTASVGTFWDSKESWPRDNNLFLNGFVYERFGTSSPTDATSRINWLHLQSQDQFLPQPYEQLGKVLRNMGLEEEAVEIIIEKNKDYGGRLPWYSLSRVWYGFFGKIIAFGYKPFNALWYSLVIISLSTRLFWLGFRHKLFVATDESAYDHKIGPRFVKPTYPKFHALVYSLETFVPLVKLGVGEFWLPNASAGAKFPRCKFGITWGSWLRGYYWLHNLAGWILTTLWVTGLTGLVKT